MELFTSEEMFSLGQINLYSVFKLVNNKFKKLLMNKTCIPQIGAELLLVLACFC